MLERIECPYSVLAGKRKQVRFRVNLNEYCNWNHFVSKRNKKAFAQHMEKQIDDIVRKHGKQSKMYLHYIFHPNTARLYDTMNVVSVTSKFLLDAMVERGLVKDDNYKIVVFESLETGFIDRGRSRAYTEIIVSDQPIYKKVPD